jgi:hypothetical protein
MKTRHRMRLEPLDKNEGRELAELFEKYGMVDASSLRQGSTFVTGLSLSHGDRSVCERFERVFDGSIRQASKTTWQWRISGKACSAAAGHLILHIRDLDMKGLLMTLIHLRETLDGTRERNVMAQMRYINIIDDLKYDMMKNRKNGTPRLEPSPAQTADSKSEIQDDIADLFGSYDGEPDLYLNRQTRDTHTPEPEPRDPFEIMKNAGFEPRIQKDSNGEGA